MKDINKYKLLYIHWRDTCSYPGWYDEDGGYEVNDIHSTGWLLEDKKDCIVIAQSIHSNGCGEMLAIPKECIVRKKERA